MQQPVWDDLDERILKGIVQHPGGSIRDAIRPFLKERTETTLRTRVRRLWIFELIELRPDVTKVKCYPLIDNIKKIKGMQDTLGGVHDG